MGSSDQKFIGPHLWQRTAVREASAIALVSALLFVAYRLSSIFTPVVLALLAAYLIHPIVKFIEHRSAV
jgi:predicted PurR-regulated permease PerM